jgi:hypothetical protein
MRLRNLLSAAALVASLVAGLAWCAGPCCGAMSERSSGISIGATPCCGGSTPDHCAVSIQRADDLASAPQAPSVPPVALLVHGGATTAPSILPSVAVTARPNLPRPDLARLDAPLLI